MGCTVSSPAVHAKGQHGSRATDAELSAEGEISRAPTHAEKVAQSPLPNPLNRLSSGIHKLEAGGSGSDGQTSTEPDTIHPDHAAQARRNPLQRDGSAASARAPGHSPATAAAADSREAAAVAEAGSGAAGAHAGRLPKQLSLRESPFTKTPTKQRILSLGSGVAHTNSCDGVAAPGTGGGGGLPLPSNAQFLTRAGQARSASATYSAGGNALMQESQLSDISATLSTISTTVASSTDLVSPSYNSGAGGRNSIKNGLFRNGDDLEAQRQQAPLSIEEDLFIYDDIVISKDEARTKHWRLVGRKPAVALDTAGATGEGGAGGAAGPGTTGRSNSLKEKSFFTFNDFDVCVDEMDWMPVTAGAATNIAPLVQSSAESTTTSADMHSITSTRTFAAEPRTVARYLAQSRLTEAKANRPLRSFEATAVLGHATRVKCIALSPAETDFASCSNEDASITLNNLGVRSEVGIFTGHQDTIINAAFSPDGKYLATTSKDRTMILWDVMTTKNLLSFTHPKVVICCSFGPDSKYLVSGCQDRICRLWDTKRGKEWLSYTGHDGIIIAIAFSPDGNYVCSASADKSLRVWSATTAKTRFHLTGHTGIILSCSYTADGRHIISNDESLLCVWSTENGSCTLSLSPAAVAGATLLNSRGPKLGWTLSSAAPGAFTGYMLVACNNRFVYVLDIETGEEVTNTFCKAPVYCLTAGSYGKMACGDSFGNIYILSLT